MKKMTLATSMPTAWRTTTVTRTRSGRLRRSVKSIAKMVTCARRITSVRSRTIAGTRQLRIEILTRRNAWRCILRRKEHNLAGIRTPRTIRQRWRSTRRMVNTASLDSPSKRKREISPSAPQQIRSCLTLRRQMRPTTAQRRILTKSARSPSNRIAMWEKPATLKSSVAAVSATKQVASVRASSEQTPTQRPSRRKSYFIESRSVIHWTERTCVRKGTSVASATTQMSGDSRSTNSSM